MISNGFSSETTPTDYVFSYGTHSVPLPVAIDGMMHVLHVHYKKHYIVNDELSGEIM
jgi:hypothetical protein